MERLRRLAPLLTEARRQKIADVVASRSGSLAVLLENVADRGNRNAVMRSMDAFGVHTLHTLHTLDSAGEKVETARNKKKKNKGGETGVRTDKGARNWIVWREWSGASACLRSLKGRGFKIASAVPDAEVRLADVDLTQRLVIAFGSETEGLSEALLRHSDLHFSIPMTGFVQSLNLSVSVAVVLHSAYTQRLARLVRGN